MTTTNYISTEILPLKQISNKEMFIGKLTVEQIVSVIRYTDRKSIALDPLDDKSNPNAFDQQYYQRVRDSDRAYEIKLFIIKQLHHLYSFAKNQVSPLALFPSAIILGCTTDESIKNINEFQKLIEINKDESALTEIVLVDQGKIYIAKGENTLVVDGQHRIAGMENLLEEAIEGEILLKKSDKETYQSLVPPVNFILKALKEFEFLVTFLIDFDRYEQAELFANVNFNQKPVNKSFYYDIFGTAQRGKSLVKLLHDLTAHLNYSSASPLSGKIKMLGSGTGFFSQAFFVEALIPLFKKGLFFSIFVDYQEDGNDYKLLPKFFRAYFSSFFETFSKYFPNSVLVKTTGMGAIVSLIPYIYNRVKEMHPKPLSLEEKELKSLIKRLLNPLSVNGETYFGLESGFASGAGKGLQGRLYRKLLNDLVENENKKKK